MASSKNDNNESFVKYGGIVPLDSISEVVKVLKNRKVGVFEKVDGGNCQVSVSNFQIRLGTRAKFLKGKKTIERVPWFGRFVDWAHSNHSLYALPGNRIVFGEWLGNHSIEYNPEFIDKFFVIDVFDRDSRKFIPYEEARKEIISLGVEGVNFLDVLKFGRLSFKDFDLMLNKERSGYYSGPREGLVIKDYHSDPQEFWKILHPDFAEKREGVFGGLNVDYLTSFRFMKAFHRLLDRGKSSVTLTGLVDEVRRDIRKERGFNYTREKVIESYKTLSASEEMDKIRKFFGR
ncbi:MAG: RNA ligase family protein [Candidatus Pacearchaeota archaeon]|nr:RNA ligase family protein [Candidatus Pacearchaeota archaeon]